MEDMRDRIKEAWIRIEKTLQKASIDSGATLVLRHSFDHKRYPKHKTLRINITAELLASFAASKKIIVSLDSDKDEEKSKRLEISRLSATDASLRRFVPERFKEEDNGCFDYLSLKEYSQLKLTVLEILLAVIDEHVGKVTLRRSKPKKHAAKTEKKDTGTGKVLPIDKKAATSGATV